MSCIFDIKKEDKHCLFCTAENCDERNDRVPPCGKCTHLVETRVSDICSTLECDLPQGNRKASRAGLGCEHFNLKNK